MCGVNNVSFCHFERASGGEEPASSGQKQVGCGFAQARLLRDKTVFRSDELFRLCV